ncbi:MULTISPECIES: copper resistance CopC family protein [Bacillaceae]|uniref:copper resistance CopC family protein n=1 Tax=Bacillaceae TaxID=186817 RepID=UPI0014564AD1|nr:copper resistance CopC family protein [Bacillus sp. RO1]NLP52135.1 copper resistance protein CopC [Bacillus sp. RO1]
MNKAIILTIILSIFSFNQVSAHTGLESSDPVQGDTVSDELEEVILNFETKVEANSTLTVLDPKETEVPVEVEISGQQMKGILTQPLEAGDYQVLWKIIGADGHPIEGEVTFSVSNDETITEQQEDNHTEEVDRNIEGIEHNTLPSYILPSIVGIFSISILVSLWWLLRRKK